MYESVAKLPCGEVTVAKLPCGEVTGNPKYAPVCLRSILTPNLKKQFGERDRYKRFLKSTFDSSF